MTDDDWQGDDLSKPENPNAFPRPYSYDESEAFHYLAHPGMSLRDWFAGQALAAIMEDCARSDAYGHGFDEYARMAYRLADAMLAEREK